MVKFDRVLRVVLGVLGAVAALCLWQFVATAGPLASSLLPSATTTFAEAARLLTTADMWLATWETVRIAFIGLCASLIGGVLVGIMIGISPLAMHATRVPLEFLKPIPPIVVLPIAVLVLGSTAEMAVFLILFGGFIGFAIQTSAGVFDTDPVARDTGRSYGMGGAEVLYRIVLPSALPYIGTALRIAAPGAILVTVVAGLLGGAPGLGRMLLLAQLSGNRPQLFAYVVILGVLGVLVQGLSEWGERRLLHWHPQYRKESHA